MRANAAADSYNILNSNVNCDMRKSIFENVIKKFRNFKCILTHFFMHSSAFCLCISFLHSVAELSFQDWQHYQFITVCLEILLKMSMLQKYCFTNKTSSLSLLRYHIRSIHKSCYQLADKVSAENESAVEKFDILEELREPDLTEEEILQKRFKSRLPERVHKMFIKKEPVLLDHKYNFQSNRLRAYYARFGKESKLNPGICWPTREEVLETIEYDKIFQPTLEARLKNVEEERLAKEKRKQEIDSEVDKNMANSDKWIADYNAKIEAKKSEQLALKQKKERLIDEISEYLGYEIDSRDPRFQEAVEQRNKEQKKARKVKKQQESYEKMITKLKQMAESK